MLNENDENENEENNEVEQDDFEPQKIKIIVKELKFKLTQSELDAKVGELVQITNVKIPMIQDTMKLATKRYKAEIDELESEAFKIGNIFISKNEDRKCDCVWRYNRKSKKMDLVRLAFKDPQEQESSGEILSLMRENLVDEDGYPWEDRAWYPDIVIESRDLTPEERQLELDLKKKSVTPEMKEDEKNVKTAVENIFERRNLNTKKGNKKA